ncbi:hypothetical protein [Brevibacterium yomogidense]|uniref:hypothetical protein n=1 Tax=Brevibacterium yomogidense TaxID=946573 RepID=UPI0018DF1AB2|nr:hypothetical protein [Brevibacterium yomogidense]
MSIEQYRTELAEQHGIREKYILGNTEQELRESAAEYLRFVANYKAKMDHKENRYDA